MLGIHTILWHASQFLMCGAHTAPAVSPSVYHSRAHTQGPLEWVGGNLPPKDSSLPREPSPPPWDKPGSLSPQIRKFQVPRKESTSLSLSLPCLPPHPPAPQMKKSIFFIVSLLYFPVSSGRQGWGGGRNTKQAVRSPGGSWVFFLEEASWKEGTREKV